MTRHSDIDPAPPSAARMQGLMDSSGETPFPATHAKGRRLGTRWHIRNWPTLGINRSGGFCLGFVLE